MSAILTNSCSPRTAAVIVPPRAVIASAPAVDNAACIESQDELFEALNSGPDGLTQAEAELRLVEYGPNQIAQQRRRGWPIRLLKTTRNPLVILLATLSAISFATGDLRAGVVMTLIVIVSVGLRFVQEFRADAAADKLKAMIHVTATVVRDKQVKEIPLSQLVPGDLLHLAAGDMIPADVRLLTAKDLFINQATLTGESFPVEKFHVPLAKREGTSPTTLNNICLLGTSVESGTATALVIVTGPRTYLGGLARTLLAAQPPNSFDKGITRFTWLMIKPVAVLVPLVFLINGLTKQDWKGAFFFSMAIAVGLTPEMLPMIVSVCLSKGALAMSRKRVIVKRLGAIQNLGAMDVLCTDKTGTLTLDRVILERHCDVAGSESEGVLLHGYLISHFQTGLKNVLDRAILDCRDFHAQDLIQRYRKLDEIPFDFSRRMMSVVLESPEGQAVLLAKGAPEEVFRRCSHFDLDGERCEIDPLMIEDLRDEYQSLAGDGFRVLAVAYKQLPRRDAYSQADECDLVLKGYIAFLDPPKESAAPAIVALGKHGVTVKLLTGDNPIVSRKVCAEVGLEAEQTLLGEDIERMTDEELTRAIEQTTLFARLLPAHKQRIIRALKSSGHVVGFLGDGTNDAPALRMADVGVSVDTAVDVAKESASIILLEKSLMVLDEGVIEGRKVFANILKYIRMGASSNFGNVLSIVGGSAFLPFLPMAPIQVLTNNLLYDISQIPIPTDDVDAEQLAKPRRWHIEEIRRFIFFFGPLSSVFDYATFFVLLWIFGCWDPARASTFQTGWFVESLLTQTLIIHVIRTNRIPFCQSRASSLLTLTTALIIALGIWLPFSPLGPSLGFVRLPASFWPILVLILLSYAVFSQLIKSRLMRIE